MDFLRSKVMAYLFLIFGVLFTGLGVASLFGLADYSTVIIAPGIMCLFAGAVLMRPTGRPEE